MVRSSKQLFLGGLCSERNAFPRTSGARSAEELDFFYELIRILSLLHTKVESEPF